MGRKATATKIKKDRLDLILNSRKITITKMAEDMGYNRKSLSRAINREDMAAKTLDDIAQYLDVMPGFLRGDVPLMKITDEKAARQWIGNGNSIYSYQGSKYFVPAYSTQNAFFSSVEDDNNKLFFDLLVHIGSSGYMDPDGAADPVYFGADFIRDNFEYLKEGIVLSTLEGYGSITNNTENFQIWQTVYKKAKQMLETALE